jgi:hypothetical protein
MPTSHATRLDCLYCNLDPDLDSYSDDHNLALNPLEYYLAGRVPNVSLAVDPGLHLAYNTPISIPEVDAWLGVTVPFAAVARTKALFNQGAGRATVSVNTFAFFRHAVLNGPATLVF